VAADASEHPAYAEGHNCSNCMFFNEADHGCQLFPGKAVEAAGWCQSWVQKP